MLTEPRVRTPDETTLSLLQPQPHTSCLASIITVCTSYYSGYACVICCAFIDRLAWPVATTCPHACSCSCTCTPCRAVSPVVRCVKGRSLPLLWTTLCGLATGWQHGQHACMRRRVMTGTYDRISPWLHACQEMTMTWCVFS